jgi:DNA (cytosine-5)-methyltransferase 1
MEKTTALRYIDIFAGCGGLSLGLYKAGWKGIFAIEKNKMAFATLKHNLVNKRNHFDWPSWLPVTEHDINDVLVKHRQELEKLKGEVDLVAGGPPCQGFSLAGRRNKDDERNQLANSYIEFISLVKPKILFFENVKGFTIGFKDKDSRAEAYSDYVLRELRKLDYEVHPKIIDFSDFGIPQRRKRFILVGVLNGDPALFFEKIDKEKAEFLKNRDLKDKITLGEAISDLERKHGETNSVEFKNFKEGVYGKPKSNYQKLLRKDHQGELPDSHRFANHKKETLDKFKYILGNCIKDRNIAGDIKERYNLNKKCIIPLDESTQCPTLTTLPDDYIHYSEPRILTVREYARIQSFDDWFEFKEQYTTGGTRRKGEVPRYTQVGNAIPPMFMELSGMVLKGMA